MKDISKYQGIIPAFYACYDDEGNISPERVQELTRHLVKKGVKGVYVGGSSGECIYQSVSTFQNICSDADRSTAEQATLFVAGRVRELYCLFNILNGDQTLEVAFFVHQRQLFDLVLAENRLCFFHSRAYRSRDQVILGHYFRDRAVIVGQEPHVTVGDDAHQLAHIVYDRHAGDLVLAHQSIGI